MALVHRPPRNAVTENRTPREAHLQGLSACGRTNRLNQAEALYLDLVRALQQAGITVATGVFRAHMDVELINDGPVTMLLDSRRLF